MNTEYTKDTLQAFKKMISRKNTPETFGLIKEQNMGKLSKYFAKRKTLIFTHFVVTSFCVYKELSRQRIY